MNWYLLAGLIITVGGLLIVRKKMNVSKEDGKKLVAKIKGKKKMTEYEKEFEKNGCLVSVDKKDYVNFDNFKESVKDNPKTMERLNTMDSDWREFGYEAEDKE